LSVFEEGRNRTGEKEKNSSKRNNPKIEKSRVSGRLDKKGGGEKARGSIQKRESRFDRPTGLFKKGYALLRKERQGGEKKATRLTQMWGT